MSAPQHEGSHGSNRVEDVNDSRAADTIETVRGEIGVVLETARELELEADANKNVSSETVARFEGRRRQLEEIMELLIDAEEEVRSS